jgi:hypothetical protein
VRIRTRIMILSVTIVALGGGAGLRAEEAQARMCGPSSCGVCCYGQEQEELESCCVANGCTQQCYLITSGCCPGGYQLDHC